LAIGDWRLAIGDWRLAIEAGRKSRRRPTLVMGMKANGKCQLKSPRCWLANAPLRRKQKARILTMDDADGRKKCPVFISGGQ
jgi:hypothetical protein